MTQPDLIPREAVLAAMRQLEEQTLRRCAAVAVEYASRRVRGKPSSRIAGAKASGALDVAQIISDLPRKSA